MHCSKEMAGSTGQTKRERSEQNFLLADPIMRKTEHCRLCSLCKSICKNTVHRNARVQTTMLQVPSTNEREVNYMTSKKSRDQFLLQKIYINNTSFTFHIMPSPCCHVCIYIHICQQFASLLFHTT